MKIQIDDTILTNLKLQKQILACVQKSGLLAKTVLRDQVSNYVPHGGERLQFNLMELKNETRTLPLVFFKWQEEIPALRDLGSVMIDLTSMHYKTEEYDPEDEECCDIPPTFMSIKLRSPDDLPAIKSLVSMIEEELGLEDSDSTIDIIYV